MREKYPCKKIGGKSGEGHFLEGRACGIGLPCVQHAVITQSNTGDSEGVGRTLSSELKGKFQYMIVGKKNHYISISLL